MKQRLRWSVWAASLLLGCDSVEAATKVATNDAAAPPTTPAAAPEPTKHARSSRRCGECHVEIVDDWRSSGHAGSASDPLYLAMRADADDASCDSCHAPLASHLPPSSAVAAEGVTCDVCHSIERASMTAGRGDLTLDLTSNVKRGPICDSRDHYFHRVACDPMFERAEMCAGCHSLERHAGPSKIVVHGEYAEWKASGFGPDGANASCQSCHMPSRDGAVAEGWDAHSRISGHGGAKDPGSGLHVSLSIRAGAGGDLSIRATVRNADAGHSLPTGLPERRIVLRMRTLDTNGSELGAWEHAYGTWLVDEAERPVPFYLAARVAREDRIAAGETRVHAASLPAPAAARLEVELLQYAIAPEIAARLAFEPPVPERLDAAHVDIPAQLGARKRAFARPIEVFR